jgi:hypothetical protein
MIELDQSPMSTLEWLTKSITYVMIDTARWRHIAPSKSPTVSEAAEKWIKRVEADDPERPVKQYRQHLVHQPQGARRVIRRLS